LQFPDVNLTTLLLFSFAAWRIASLLVREAGPFHVFIWIRERAGIQHEEDGTPYLFPDTFLAGVLSCVLCLSMWVALGWFLFWLAAPGLAIKIAAVFAISTGAILIDRWMGN
jgi:hypothetical protein